MLVAIGLAVGASHGSAQPQSAGQPRLQDYQGLRLVQDYDNPVKAPPEQRDARSFLDSLSSRPPLEHRFQSLQEHSGTSYSALSWRRGRLFALRTSHATPGPVIIVISALTNLSSEKVVLDPRQLDPSGAITINWIEPSLDGGLVAVSLSKAGREKGTLHVYETGTGRRHHAEVLHDVRPAGAGGSLAWTAGNAGFFYVRQEPGTRPAGPGTALRAGADVFYHRLGTPQSQDQPAPGHGLPSVAAIQLEPSPDGQRVLASVPAGSGPGRLYSLREGSGKWRLLTRSEDQIEQASFGRDPAYIEFGKDDALYFLSRRAAPRGKILRLSLRAGELRDASVILPEGTNTIQSFQAGPDGLFLLRQGATNSSLAYVDFRGKFWSDPGANPVEPAAVSEWVVAGQEGVLYRTDTYTEPPAWRHFQPAPDRQRAESIELGEPAGVSFADVEVTRVIVAVADGSGAEVALDLMRKKGLRRAGPLPTLLSAAVSPRPFASVTSIPDFQVWRRVWLDQGGLIATAILPAPGLGAERNDGRDLARLFACAEYLVRSNYSVAARLAIQPNTPGDLLLGAPLTPRPVWWSRAGEGNRTAAPGPGGWVRRFAEAHAFLFDQLGLEYSRIDRGPWSGAITPTSAQVKAKLFSDRPGVRLVVGTNAAFAGLTRFIPPVRLKGDANIVSFSITGLQPDTAYHYALEIDGRREQGKAGEFRTFPAPGPASFSVAWASCARTGSTSEVFDRIRENRPLLYMNIGDLHYSDIRTNDPARFRAAYDAVLGSPQQAELYRHIPFLYMWDDHDFGGNNSTGRSPAHEAARLTYEDYVPHYPLTFPYWDEPICQSFAVGRVKFIVTDLRSQRDNPRRKDDADKTMLGWEQKRWLKRELLEARGKFPLICWVSSVPWVGEARTNYYHWVATNQYGFIHHSNRVATTTAVSTNRAANRPDDDHWSVYATERREIADFIRSNHIGGVCVLHGDSHMLAADDGSHSDYATGGGAPLPVMCAAPLDKEPSLKGGPYSQGVYRVHDKLGEGGFGLLRVQDRGDRIEAHYSGRNNHNEEKISLNFSVPAAVEPAVK